MKLIISVIILFFSLSLIANSIDKETAILVAKNYMTQKGKNDLIVLNVIEEKLEGETSFFVVNFYEGGWIMISASENAIPILGYSFEGNYKLEDIKPDAFIEWTNGYKEQIKDAKKLKIQAEEVKEKWDRLCENTDQKSSVLYTPGHRLLNVSGRGHVQWSQGQNNDGGCTPSYSKFCPSSSGCVCGNKIAGCGSVAMGQVMWYWQWPLNSSYRTYNWSLMPSELKNITTTPEGDEVAHLISDCGLAADMDYYCDFSWTFVDDVVDALKNEFNYKGVGKHVKAEWNYSDAWNDLIRSEIDLGRPVIYRGDNCDFCPSKHIFVIDGYDAYDPNYFWFNFGWGYPGNDYNISRQYLGDLTPGSHNYNKNQMAIVGISPYYSVAPVRQQVTELPYTTITDSKIIKASNLIAIPGSGNSLTVETTGALTLLCEEDIAINSTFNAKLGSTLKMEIVSDIGTDPTLPMEITVENWKTGFTPNGDGYYDELCFNVENADSWEFEARYSLTGYPLFQSAGLITGNTACVWNGVEAESGTSYMCTISFKNSYGRRVSKTYSILVYF